jgi:hypothetical protein
MLIKHVLNMFYVFELKDGCWFDSKVKFKEEWSEFEMASQ